VVVGATVEFGTPMGAALDSVGAACGEVETSSAEQLSAMRHSAVKEIPRGHVLCMVTLCNINSPSRYKETESFLVFQVAHFVVSDDKPTK
jgi:hypothetical protein